MSELALKHVEHLSMTIGPRGSCTPQEKRASEYCRQVLHDLGYEVHWQDFRAPRSGWAPYSIASGLVLISLVVFLSSPTDAGRIVAGVLTSVVTISVLLQLTFRPNPLVWLVPPGSSQNVYAVARALREPQRTIVLVGHVDTHRTPWAMASPSAFHLFQWLTKLGVIAFVVLSVLFILAAAWPVPIWKPLALLPAVIVGVVLVVTLQPEFSPYVPGANDNASGAGAVLALAARVKAHPLRNVEVWFLNSGAEEVGAMGPVKLLRKHPELRNADWLVLDTIAGPGTNPCMVRAEHLLIPLPADPRLLTAARYVAITHTNLGVYERSYRGLFSEHSPLTVAGCRSLALMGFTPNGFLPNWHRPTDTFDRVDPQVLHRAEEFVWELLLHWDRQAEG